MAAQRLVLSILLTFVALVGPVYAFVAPSIGSATGMTTSRPESSSRLFVGPLQKLTNKQEYNRVVEGLMLTRGITREEAEKEYDSYLDNPNNYALNKVSGNTFLWRLS